MFNFLSALEITILLFESTKFWEFPDIYRNFVASFKVGVKGADCLQFIAFSETVLRLWALKMTDLGSDHF